jgi:acetate kinase
VTARVSQNSPLDVLALNCGSSSLKFGVFRAHDAEVETLVSGEIAAIGGAGSTISAAYPGAGKWLSQPVRASNCDGALASAVSLLAEWNAPTPAAVGHRLVHGGPKLLRHCLIDRKVKQLLKTAAAFAPLHMPAALGAIRFAERCYPGASQVACFDTVFHAQMPDVAHTLPIPRELSMEGVHRYGFHGLSCESVVRQLASNLPERMIIAHLGAGASITAVKAGRSVDTSMGLTPTGGLPMATRSGDLDPGILIYLMRKGLGAAALEDLVERRSGLLAVSGLSGDMRDLRKAAPSNTDAALAIDLFSYAVRKQIAAMAAALEGVDLLVFTGGIGENDEELRNAVCAGLGWMGLDLDGTRAPSASPPINPPYAPVAVQVLASQEDQQIARHTADLASAALNGRPFVPAVSPSPCAGTSS